MKCPKCEYLGFETGERCKNCGYDFSLLAVNAFDDPSSEPDISIRSDDFGAESMDMWLKDLDQALPTPTLDAVGDLIEPRSFEASAASAPAPVSPVHGENEEDGDDVVEILLDPLEDLPEAIVAPPEPAVHLRAVEPPLPLFTPGDAEDDAPLITLPAAPRPPLAVRRTPDVPRLRAVSRLRAVEPALDFQPELRGDEDGGDDNPSPDIRVDARASAAAIDGWPVQVTGRRLAAAAIDHVILLSIDLAVMYFTLRMAGLLPSEWRMIPPVPMGIFLGMMALAYFTAFTAVGGQTIGKMAAGIRVVGADCRPVDGVAALRRTLAAVLSYATAGLAYLPGFFGDRRTVHDRLAGTRVVAPPSI